MCAIIIPVRSGQQRYNGAIHLSDFKNVSVWSEGQHIDAIYIFSDLLIFYLSMIHII